MLPSKLTILGSIAFAAGMLVIGLALAIGGNLSDTASAGNQCSTSTTVPTADPTATTSVQIGSLQVAPCTATSTTRPRSATPTKSATAEATTTQAPHTPVATMAVVPTATLPGGGAGGAAIQAPNTGTGTSAGGGLNMWLLGAGIMLATFGGGAVLATVRRRS